MPHLNLSLDPPTFWSKRCELAGNVFHSLEWQGLLEQSFSSSSVYVWDSASDTGSAITIFPVGPFRIGYVGFPVGGVMGDKSHYAELITRLTTERFPTRVDALRLPISAFDNVATLDSDNVQLPETVIERLDYWQPEQLSKLRRVLQKSEGLPLSITEANDPAVGESLYQLYLMTIKRHGAQLRYNAPYFKALLQLTHEKPALRCFTALHENTLAGFVIAAISGGRGYYLHGAHEPALKQYHPSDQLFQRMIAWAKSQGATRFSFLASPTTQPSLVRYKEKWGGTTRMQTICTVPINRLMYSSFRILERLYRLIR